MADNTQTNAEVLTMPDAEVTLYRGFFTPTESDTLFQELSNQINWKQESAVFPGGKVPLPRLTAWYSDEGKSYSYSGITVHPNSWTPTLLAIKERVESAAGVQFNSVLLNFYRNEQDSVGWHSDDEPELGTNPVIASVSFGAERAFQFKHKQDTELRQSVELSHGSLLLMAGPTQHHWKHQIPKTKKPHGPRINLTFRIIKS
jgi:alkylated DNA repair dioxygenase AlkB